MKKLYKNIKPIIIRQEDLNLRNELHFNTQLNTRAHIFKPKKGKGSYTRKSKYKGN